MADYELPIGPEEPEVADTLRHLRMPFDGLVELVPFEQQATEPEEWEEPIVQRPLIDDQGRVLDYGPGV